MMDDTTVPDGKRPGDGGAVPSSPPDADQPILKPNGATDTWLTAADLALGGVSEIASLPGESYRRRAPRKVAGRTGRWVERYSHQHTVAVPQRSVYVFQNVFAADSSFIFRRDGTVYPGTIPPQAVDAQGRLKRALPAPLDPAFHADEPIIHAVNPGLRNFGHWLVDTLPRVAWARTLPGLDTAKVMIHERSPAIAVELLARIGVGADQIVTLGAGGAFCPTLVYPSMWGHQRQGSHAADSFALFERMRAAVSPAVWSDPPRKIFLGRDDARNRQLANEDELLAVLRDAGYVKINAGFLTIDEQIRVFSNAESIVAISGAALTNLVFCDPRCSIINLSPDSMPSTFFWDLAHHKRTPYAMYYGDASEPDRIHRSDFTVDVEDFLTAFGDDL